MRRLDWLMIIALVIGAIATKVLDYDNLPSDPRNPRRPATETFEPKFWDQETRGWLAQAPSKTGKENPAFAQLPSEGIIQQDSKPSSSVGSAFSISDRGLWLTARHVVEGCDRTLIQTGHKKAMRVRRIDQHPNADIAVLRTDGAPPSLAFADTNRALSDAYGIGFPKGDPGAIHGRYIGEMTMRHRGRNGYRERVNAWSERSRIPSRTGSLGGLSGGAVLDDQGNIIGIVQAESRRRGRVMTAKLETIHRYLERVSAKPDTQLSRDTNFELDARDYPLSARQLITRLRVAKVLCFVN